MLSWPRTAEPLVAGRVERIACLAGRVGHAGDAASPPPGPGPAAGGCAFRRLRSSASQAKRLHPCKLDGAIHGANAPAWPTRPASDSFRGRPATEERKKSKSGSLRCACSDDDQRSSPTTNKSRPPQARHVSTKVDTHQQQCSMQSRQIAGTCRRRGGSGCGGVSAMDGAIEATGTYLRRPPQPEPPRHPTDSPLLTLTLTLLRLRRVQGAALQSKPHPQ